MLGFLRKRRSWAKAGLLAAVSASLVFGLSGCIAAPITISGSGTTAVTVSWSGTATSQTVNNVGFPVGDVLIICSLDQADNCNNQNGLYFDFLADGSTSTVITTDTPVYGLTGSTRLPPCNYVMAAFSAVYQNGDPAPTPTEVGGVMSFTIADGDPDKTIWYQSIGPDSNASTCPDGWQPSWAQWPNNGAGGFVCNKQTYRYYPDVPVTDTTAIPTGTPWLQSVGRAAVDAPCTSGYDPSWAQWPNNGAGGFVCNKQSTL